MPQKKSSVPVAYVSPAVRFGERLKAARCAESQAKAAMRLSIPQTAFSRIESGTKPASFRQLMTLLRAFPALYDALRECADG